MGAARFTFDGKARHWSELARSAFLPIARLMGHTSYDIPALRDVAVFLNSLPKRKNWWQEVAIQDSDIQIYVFPEIVLCMTLILRDIFAGKSVN